MNLFLPLLVVIRQTQTSTRYPPDIANKCFLSRTVNKTSFHWSTSSHALSSQQKLMRRKTPSGSFPINFPGPKSGTFPQHANSVRPKSLPFVFPAKAGNQVTWIPARAR